MDTGAPADDGLDVDRPSVGRIYDYLLGGVENFAADRQVAERVLAAFPAAPVAVHANRAFLRRAVQYLADTGVRQFLDVGSGIPTMGQVHEIAQRTVPGARVVYADIDPVAVSRGRQLLADNSRTAAIHADVRAPERLLAHPAVRDVLDLDQPVAVLLVAVLHFVADADDPVGIVARLTRPLAAGSHVALSHVTADALPALAHVQQIYRSAGIAFVPRGVARVRSLLDGMELVPPGLVDVARWRPQAGQSPDAQAVPVYLGAVGRLT